MIKWLSDIFSMKEEIKEINSQSTCSKQEFNASKWWSLDVRLYFLQCLKSLILENMIAIEKDDSRYTKLTHWLELTEILIKSMSEGGLKAKVQINLGLEVEEDCKETYGENS